MKGYLKRLVLTAVIAMAMPAQGEWVTAESGLNLRAQTTLKSSVLALMPYGTELEVIRTIGVGSDVWADVEFEGIHGYCKKEWLSPEDPFEGMTYKGEWHITAYAYTGYRCANGEYPSVGKTVACNSLPFGAKVYIAGVGFRTVEDRGPSWLGDEWLDLYLGDTAECIQWGSQYRKVWVADE